MLSCKYIKSCTAYPEGDGKIPNIGYGLGKKKHSKQKK